MVDINEVRKLALEIFEQENVAEVWLNTPKWFFNGLTADEMLQKPDGGQAVLGILEKIRDGEFS
ncbi:MbcA/ParS/Xre antitoxin family protein [Vibrio agarivorans]|uniref:MbcA/ParS/Xre antitoxin family protein n=1 Tax=Vibrio agarivorans TaxID=153622 RepID=UPI0025B38F01|nr:MbcA/ParS/Xre antitoxin family protein [Vibrio agarivorans]MDN3663149.1 MbcA/ParS/Xre antitoxin family protein [Vibrio agarivorans]